MNRVHLFVAPFTAYNCNIGCMTLQFLRKARSLKPSGALKCSQHTNSPIVFADVVCCCVCKNGRLLFDFPHADRVSNENDNPLCQSGWRRFCDLYTMLFPHSNLKMERRPGRHVAMRTTQTPMDCNPLAENSCISVLLSMEWRIERTYLPDALLHADELSEGPQIAFVFNVGGHLNTCQALQEKQ